MNSTEERRRLPSAMRCPPIGIGNNLGREVKEGETCAKEG